MVNIYSREAQGAKKIYSRASLGHRERFLGRNHALIKTLGRGSRVNKAEKGGILQLEDTMWSNVLRGKETWVPLNSLV